MGEKWCVLIPSFWCNDTAKLHREDLVWGQLSTDNALKLESNTDHIYISIAIAISEEKWGGMINRYLIFENVQGLPQSNIFSPSGLQGLVAIVVKKRKEKKKQYSETRTKGYGNKTILKIALHLDNVLTLCLIALITPHLTLWQARISRGSEWNGSQTFLPWKGTQSLCRCYVWLLTGTWIHFLTYKTM